MQKRKVMGFFTKWIDTVICSYKQCLLFHPVFFTKTCHWHLCTVCTKKKDLFRVWRSFLTGTHRTWHLTTHAQDFSSDFSIYRATLPFTPWKRPLPIFPWLSPYSQVKKLVFFFFTFMKDLKMRYRKRDRLFYDTFFFALWSGWNKMFELAL